MRRNLVSIASLVFLAVCVQTWMILRAVTPAQDTVRFVAIAKAMERDGVRETVRDRPEPPLYPLSIRAVHRAIGEDSGESWVASAQVAAAIPLVLTVIPLFFLFLRLTKFHAAFIGTLFFIVLTPAARLGADALNDATHLLFCMAGLWAVTAAFRVQPAVVFDKTIEAADGMRSVPATKSADGTRSVPATKAADGMRSVSATKSADGTRSVPATKAADGARSLTATIVAGLCIGLGVLARKEALLLPGVFLATIVVLQSMSGWRQSWRLSAWRIAAITGGMAAVLLPYLWITNAVRPELAVARLLGRPTETVENWRAPVSAAKKSNVPPYLADASFAKKDPQASLRFSGYPAAAAEYIQELPKALGYGPAVLVLVGIVLRLRRKSANDRAHLSVKEEPADATAVFLALLFVAWSLLAIHFAAGIGYLSPRHLLPAVVPLLAYAAEGGLWLGHRLATSLTRQRRDKGESTSCACPARVGIAWLPVAIAGVVCVIQTAAPLHESRQAHREAGQWLSHAPGRGSVLDTRGLTGLYSSRRTYDFPAAKKAVRDKRLAYIVIERQERQFDSPRARTLRRILAAGGERVAVFVAEGAPDEKMVEVYRWDRRKAAAWSGVERLAN